MKLFVENKAEINEQYKKDNHKYDGDYHLGYSDGSTALQLGNFYWLIQFSFISISFKSASKNGHSDIVEYLIKNGANLNIHDKDGNTPLLSGTIKA